MKIEEFDNEEIVDDSEMSDLLSEQFDSFLQELKGEESMTRESDPNEDPEESDFMWTDKAMRMIDPELNRLYGIGNKYFPKGDIEVTSNLYQEY